MTINLLTVLFVGGPALGLVLMLIGVASMKAEKRRQQEGQGFAIDPKLLRSGRHLTNSRSDEANFGH